MATIHQQNTCDTTTVDSCQDGRIPIFPLYDSSGSCCEYYRTVLVLNDRNIGNYQPFLFGSLFFCRPLPLSQTLALTVTCSILNVDTVVGYCMKVVRKSSVNHTEAPVVRNELLAIFH
jgi:hypothetical protein